MELHRWLRYAFPGVLFELTFGLWLYFDRRACDCYPDFPDFDTATAAAIAAATLPIGFVLSVLMHTILWYRRAGWPFCRIDAASILLDSRSAIEGNRLLELPSDAKLCGDLELAHAYLDSVLHLDAGSADRNAALGRARALMDLMNGLATGFTAIFVSILLVPVTLAVTLIRSGAWTEGSDWWWRCVILIGSLVVSGFLAGVFLSSERRVARITNHYLRALLLHPESPTAKAETDGQPQVE